MIAQVLDTQLHDASQMALDMSNMMAVGELVIATMASTQIDVMGRQEGRKAWMRICLQFKQDLEDLCKDQVVEMEREEEIENGEWRMENGEEDEYEEKVEIKWKKGGKR